MRKYINIFLGLFLLSPIIYLFGLPLYQSLTSVKLDVIKHFETNLPTEILVDNKNEVFLKVDEFITIRHKVLNKSLDKFETFCELLDKDGKVLDGSYYEYANNLNIESNRKTSTYTILRKFIKDNPYGVYLKDIDNEFLEKKIDNFKESTKIRLEFLKRKYKNKFLIDKKEYSFKKILDTFLYTYDAKQFLKNDLIQADIDEGIYKFRELTLNKTHSKYGGDFDAKPNLWNSVVDKIFYDEPLQNYYIYVFNLENNNKFKSLHSKSKKIVIDILIQSLIAHRVGMFNTHLQYLGINQYIGDSILNNIDNMITKSVDIITKSVELNNITDKQIITTLKKYAEAEGYGFRLKRNEKLVHGFVGTYKYGKKKIVITYSKPELNFECRGCASSISFFLLNNKGDILKSYINVLQVGRFGEFPSKNYFKVINIGKNDLAISLDLYDDGQGYSQEYRHIYLLNIDKCALIFNEQIAADDSGALEPSKESWKANVLIQKNRSKNNFFIISVEKSGIKDFKKFKEKNDFYYNGIKYIKKSEKILN